MTKRDRTFVGWTLTEAARRALDRQELPDRPKPEIEIYGPTRSGITEDELFEGYRGPDRRATDRRRPVRIAHKALERPETGVHDQSGLVHGEPLSEGRTAGREGVTR